MKRPLSLRSRVIARGAGANAVAESLQKKDLEGLGPATAEEGSGSGSGHEHHGSQGSESSTGKRAARPVEKENENPNSQDTVMLVDGGASDAVGAEPESQAPSAMAMDRSTSSTSTSESSVAAPQVAQQQAQPAAPTPNSSTATESAHPVEGGEEEEEEGHCDFCGQVGELVLCDTCPRAFHYMCAHTTREDVKGMARWRCPKCSPPPSHGTPSSRLKLRRVPSGTSSQSPTKVTVENTEDEDDFLTLQALKRPKTGGKNAAPPSTQSGEPPSTPSLAREVAVAETAETARPTNPTPTRMSSLQIINSTNITARASQHTGKPRVQGPTSALSTFLAERGIKPRGLNRWRARNADDTAPAGSTSTDDPSSSSTSAPASDQQAPLQRSQSESSLPAAPVSSSSPSSTPTSMYARRTRAAASNSAEEASADSLNVRFEYVMEVRARDATAKRNNKAKEKGKGAKEAGSDSDDFEKPKSRWGKRKEAEKDKAAEKKKKLEEKLEVKRLRREEKRKKRLEAAAANGDPSPPSSDSSDSDSDGSDDEYHFKRVAVCGTCGTRFPDGVLRCAKCSVAKRTPQPGRTKPKTASVGSILKELRGQVKPLQELCIEYICKNIDCVSSFGDISSDVFEKICNLTCRMRLLNDTNAHLFVGSNLDRLRLCDCADLTAAALTSIGKQCPGLKFLDLNRCGRMTDAALAQIADGCPLVTQARIGGAFLVTDEAFVYFIRSHPNLKSLCLENAPKAGAGVASSIATLTQATELSFINCTAFDDSVLAKMVLPSTLQQLAISHNTIVTDSGFSVLLDAVLASNIKLTKLDLSACLALTDLTACKVALNFPKLAEIFLEGVQMTDESGVELSSTCRSLRKLSLRRTCVGNDTLQAVALNCGRLLTHLDLNGLQEIVEDALMLITENCPNLEEIDLSWLRAVDDSFIHKLLAAAPHLSKVSVWGCNKLTECAFAPRAGDVGKSLKVLGQFII